MNWLAMRYAGKEPDDILRVLEVNAPPVSMDSVYLALGLTYHLSFEPTDWFAHVTANASGPRILIRHAETEAFQRREWLAVALGILWHNQLGRVYQIGPSERGYAPGLALRARGFAKDLLLPTWMVGPWTRRLPVNRLYQTFQVPERLMQDRLHDLYRA